MEYEVAIPLAGFEEETAFIFEKVDNFFSTITSLESEIVIKLMNFNALSNISFELADEYIKKLEINDISDINIYYIFVLQNPVKNSVLNMYAPVIFNDRAKKMGQVQLDLNNIGLETIEAMLPGF